MVNWYESLSESGQSRHCEASDWAACALVAEFGTAQLADGMNAAGDESPGVASMAAYRDALGQAWPPPNTARGPVSGANRVLKKG